MDEQTIIDEQKARRPYVLRDEFQEFIDYARGGGINGDSDLTVQIVLASMEQKNPSQSYVFEVKTKALQQLELGFRLKETGISPIATHLKRLDKLRNLCEEYGGHRIEATLETPEDIERALFKYRI